MPSLGVRPLLDHIGQAARFGFQGWDAMVLITLNSASTLSRQVLISTLPCVGINPSGQVEDVQSLAYTRSNGATPA